MERGGYGSRRGRNHLKDEWLKRREEKEKKKKRRGEKEGGRESKRRL